MSAGDIVAASALFGVADSNVRVILLRLLAEGLLQQPARGVYALSPRAKRLADEVGLWRSRNARTRPWAGDYAVVLVDRVQPAELTAKRRRAQALRLMGFEKLHANLFVRPNNLEAGVVELRARLLSFGLEDSALVFSANDFDDSTIAAIHALWCADALNQRYADETRKLQHWLARVEQMPLDAALCDSYLMGAQVIRDIAFDPMLPCSMVDSSARKIFIDTACRFDDVGHRLWMRFLDRKSWSAPPLSLESDLAAADDGAALLLS